MSFLFEIENKFEMSCRDIHVQRKFSGETRENGQVYYPGKEEENAAVFSIEEIDKQSECLEISVDQEELELGPSKVELPGNIPFTFIPAGSRSLTVIPASGRVSLKIPAGLPGWKLQLMKPKESVAYTMDGPDDSIKNNVTVGDDAPGEGD